MQSDYSASGHPRVLMLVLMLDVSDTLLVSAVGGYDKKNEGVHKVAI